MGTACCLHYKYRSKQADNGMRIGTVGLLVILAFSLSLFCVPLTHSLTLLLLGLNLTDDGIINK